MATIKIKDDISVPQYDIDAYGQVYTIGMKDLLKDTILSDTVFHGKNLILDDGFMIPYHKDTMEVL